MLKSLEGVTLRKAEIGAHSGIVYGWYYDKNYQEFFRHYPECPTIDKVAAMIKDNTFMVEYKGQIIGMLMAFNEKNVSRNIELGLLIDKDFQNKKLGMKAVILFLDYLLYTLNLYKVSCHVLTKNYRINDSLKKMGFDKEGHLKQNCFMDGNFHDESLWSITKKDFRKKYEHLLYEG